VAIVANAAAGLSGLAAWQRPALRGRWIWALTGLAQIALVVQVTTGAILESSQRYQVDRIHIFYGFVAFVTVGLVLASRDQMRGRQELLFGLAGLFLAGVALRALQVLS
jgi:hypothetical protein